MFGPELEPSPALERFRRNADGDLGAHVHDHDDHVDHVDGGADHEHVSTTTTTVAPTTSTSSTTTTTSSTTTTSGADHDDDDDAADDDEHDHDDDGAADDHDHAAADDDHDAAADHDDDSAGHSIRRRCRPERRCPLDAVCATRVRSMTENRPDNVSFNSRRGTAANGRYPRVTGDFTGTTDEIIQWAACKWGLDEDLARAQTSVESGWNQRIMGDFTSDFERLHPRLPDRELSPAVERRRHPQRPVPRVDRSDPGPVRRTTPRRSRGTTQLRRRPTTSTTATPSGAHASKARWVG